jgi:C1A family cysteine protease
MTMDTERYFFILKGGVFLKQKRLVAFAIALLCLFLFSGNSFAEILQKAPINPEFLEYQHQKIRGTSVQSEFVPKSRATGYVPSPLDLSHVTPPVFLSAAGNRDAVLPSSYDLRTSGHITGVRDQNPYGTCWSFGAMASLESTFQKAGKGTFDFSEWHLAYFAYVDEKSSLPAFTQGDPGFGSDPIFDQGGNPMKATAILARWTGAVSEEDRPYQNVSPWPESSRPLSSDPAAKRLENVYFLGGVTDAATVKNALMTYGAVPISMKWHNDFFSETYGSFYRPAEASDGGHCVTLAGWDDNYPRTNFNITPPSNGAWLVKNSWGTDFGNAGYFWLSYSDPNIADPAVYLGGDTGKYTRIYQYDPLGWVESIGFTSAADKTTAWLANIFTASGPVETGFAEILKSVSFYAGASGSLYRIEIRTDVSPNVPRSGVLAAFKEGTLAAAGYHTVEVPNVPLVSGSKFSVVIRLNTPGYNYPIPVERPVSGYSEKASASAGQSYVSMDGAIWLDLAEQIENANVCVKAFTADSRPEKPVLASPADGASNVSISVTLRTNPFVSPEGVSEHRATLWQVSTVPDFSGGFALNDESTTNLTSMAPGSAVLRPSTRYYWRVRFKDSNGAYSEWSDSRSFTTSAESSSGGGGGCNSSFMPSFAILLSVPLLLLIRK